MAARRTQNPARGSVAAEISGATGGGGEAHGGGDELDGLVGEHDGSEILAAVVEPGHHRDGLRVGPIGETADGEQVGETIAVEVGGAGRVGPGQSADAVKHEAAITIFEPLDAVPETEALRRVVEAIAIGVDEIGLSVAVQIRDVEAAAAVILIGRAPDVFVRKLALAEVAKPMHLLPFLRNQSGEIHRAIAVEVSDRREETAGLGVHDATLKPPVALVLHPARLALRVAKLTNDEIEATVGAARQIRRAHIGHAGGALEQDAGPETPVVEILQHDDGADAVVVGRELAQARDEHVEAAGGVDIAGRDVGGRGDSGGDDLLGKHAARRLANPAHRVFLRFAIEHVEQAVAVEVDEVDVGDERAAKLFRRCADGLRNVDEGRKPDHRRDRQRSGLVGASARNKEQGTHDEPTRQHAQGGVEMAGKHARR